MEIRKFKQVENGIWELGNDYKPGMTVPVRVVATRRLLEAMEEEVLGQIVNVASLPGLVGYAFALADAHVGYGAPVGAVFAGDVENGAVISPGAVGFDINCGMRLISTNLKYEDVKDKIPKLVNELFEAIPTGPGRRGFLKGMTGAELERVMIGGAARLIEMGYGWPEDKEYMEESGKMNGVDPEAVSPRAKDRGRDQMATLGGGNHYLEIQKIEKIFNPEAASAMKVFEKDQVVVMIHSGSRGFGHQIATDYLRLSERVMGRYGIKVNDKQLASVPFDSPEGQRYFGAMKCAVNFAFANRQAIMHQVRQVFAKVLGKTGRSMAMELIYDVAHNIAKVERHSLPRKSEIRNPKSQTPKPNKFASGRANPKFEIRNSKVTTKELVVHRKGATRAFGPGVEELSGDFKTWGQPVIIGGSMETGSYLLMGTRGAMEKTFGSTCHGSGRTMSRAAAKKRIKGKKLMEEMGKRGIFVRVTSYAGAAEEAGFAYKDIAEVVRSVELAGISQAVASFKPVGNIKG